MTRISQNPLSRRRVVSSAAWSAPVVASALAATSAAASDPVSVTGLTGSKGNYSLQFSGATTGRFVITFPGGDQIFGELNNEQTFGFATGITGCFEVANDPTGTELLDQTYYVGISPSGVPNYTGTSPFCA